MRRRVLLAGLLAAPAARAQAKPVRVVNAYGAGGTADVVCRLLFGRLSERTGQTYVVENRPGAAGSIAASLVARAPPDGSTLLYDATAHSVNPALFGPKLPYDTRRDFLPVYLSLVTPNTILGSHHFAPATVRDLIAAARAAPGTIDAGTTGIGSAQHITLALFNEMAGVQINHVVYRDSPAARNDLVTGRIQLQFSNTPGTVPHLRAGTARVIAHSGREPVPVLPGVEAIAATLPGFETYEWNGVFLPAGTPETINRSLNAALNEAAADPPVAETLAALGAIARPNTPEEFAAFLEEQFALHARVVRDAKIRVD
ncbi:Bug family tripartite tricarboxylate transporter substrate binding protein [Paracraurococcus lichenis]|uniref:Tripartite tricarboxylate transporter substrate-binding protein n=1 Tax=Paracraurococcus lichenis TaxID=3064888 RepID=A0ABT9DV78_9PROT|nr:tripartite tricarboxylate transporter substrate-binding protein [Paracraurococcus sp. LOR1-02]MDO9707804.1 tripartite tricarboxylate transporter substrate-binding protein [Paracraurococcus sp. LOR1-02]